MTYKSEMAEADLYYVRSGVVTFFLIFWDKFHWSLTRSICHVKLILLYFSLLQGWVQMICRCINSTEISTLSHPLSYTIFLCEALNVIYKTIVMVCVVLLQVVPDPN